ncbi:hypothetical protein [Neorhodopirellula pilleata]|uniref:hypothetical protein n=1 Tax=Neorhodopirellula pilleata TaxID=2714738 RepID=UPI0011B6EBF1|nr:hypothetical protein [Neorhodopirellula pilleata]
MLTAGGTTYYIRKTDDIIHVDRWPFSSKQFDASVEFTLLRQVIVDDDAELKTALNDGIVERHSFQLRADVKPNGE